MTDEAKDFRYYADKAERQLNRAHRHEDQIYNPNIRQGALVAAAVYAELAKAAPKADKTETFCLSNFKSEGETYSCDLPIVGHQMWHFNGEGQAVWTDRDAVAKVAPKTTDNAYAVSEMVAYVKHHEEHSSRWWGMLDVLARFLVVMGEANDDDRHAVARRLCGIEK